jgi:hypothetical protein
MIPDIGISQSENAFVLLGCHPYLLYQEDPSLPSDKFVIRENLISKKQELTTWCEWRNRESVRVMRVF